MRYQSLNTIPELQNKTPDERNTLVKAAFARDRSLSALNMLHALTVFICLPISIYLTEYVLGYRSLLRSVPLCFLLMGIVSFLVTRFLIYPLIAKVLQHSTRVAHFNNEEG